MSAFFVHKVDMVATLFRMSTRPIFMWPSVTSKK